MHGGSPAAASQRKTIQASDKEATLAPASTFVVWPPVVHLQRDDDDTPTDGYGGNSSRFIEAYLGMDER